MATTVRILKAAVRHPSYHAVMLVIYVVTAVPVFLWLRDSVLVVLLVSFETAVSTHLGAWAAEDAAST